MGEKSTVNKLKKHTIDQKQILLAQTMCLVLFGPTFLIVVVF